MQKESRYCRTLVAAALLLAGLVGGPVVAQEGEAANGDGSVARFDQVGEIVESWRVDQHLWVRGNPGLSESHLDQLERWLDENAPNWTIVLMENAQGQRFQNHRGMNAVEHALGKQLANRTDFGNLRDARTGESNGAFFILFLEERKFSYYGSDAFDRRGLGEERWVGRLDKPAIAAMRGGGRIVDAARDTVTSIESQLTRKIEAEEAAKRRAAIERDRAIAEVGQLSGQIVGEIDGMEAEVATLRGEHPAATGDLVELPLASWRGTAKAIAEYAAEEEVTKARWLADEVRREIAGYRSGLAGWVRDAGELDRLQARLDGIAPPAELPSVLGHLSRAGAALASARENHQVAESLYREQIESSDQALDRAEAEIEAWRAAVLAEQRRLAALQKMIQLAAIVAAVLFLIGLIVLNRLRLPAKKAAGETLRDWEQQLKGKFDQLFQLMDRATVIVGPASRLEDRGFTGTTLDLCRETIREVDELFIMSSATDTVVDRVENLVFPRSL